MLLACDVGGTKVLAGLFEPAPSAARGTRPPTALGTGERRPRQVAGAVYATDAYRSITGIIDAFARDTSGFGQVHAVAAGVAGPVSGGRARLTNVSWDVSVAEIVARLRTPRVRIMNDLEAMARSVEVLEAHELDVLQAGNPDAHGNAGVIAAGTGLGEASLYRIAGRLRPAASEGGHADFAARTDREIALLRSLRERYGRAEVEQVLSGPGIMNLHRFSHAGRHCHGCTDVTGIDAPAEVSGAAIAGTCPSCVDALELFVDAYGAEAGNLALRGMATAGIYVGGGIAPKILPLLRTGRFMHAFRDKPPMASLLATIPVKVILNADAGLIGAALAAQELLAMGED